MFVFEKKTNTEAYQFKKTHYLCDTMYTIAKVDENTGIYNLNVRLFIIAEQKNSL